MQRHIYSLFWRTAMTYPVKVWGAAIGAVATTIAGSFFGPYIISQFLSKLQAGSVSLSGMWPLILLYIVTQLYGQVVGWRLNMYFTWTMETAAQKDLYKRIFTALTGQSLNFHADRFGGALVSQTTKLIGSFERAWDSIIFDLIPMVVSILAATIILSFVFWQYAVILFILSVTFIVCVIVGSRFLTARNKAEAQASTAINAYIADIVSNVMTVKSYGQEKRELNELADRAHAWRNKSLSSMRGFLAASSFYSTINALLNIGALIAAVLAAEHHQLSISVAYLCVTYTFNVARQLWEMNGIMRTYNRVIGDAHDMTEILMLEPSVKDMSSDALSVTRGRIDFKNVTFSHGERDDTLFTDFNLQIPAGKRIGLVGHSGSGKTTLTKLLLRFADIDSGVIEIDGQDISRVTQESLRRSIAYVPQEPLLFHRSLRENIAYSRPNATMVDITEAARQAHAMEFIEKLPEGFDTTVGERGVKLSGGQRQRIAIARAILKDAPILLLDEATSALDSESEQLIQDALTRLMKGRTSLVIAHRLSTIAGLDSIIVLANGSIVEQGSHNELLAQKGAYAKLWTHQSGGFIEP